MDKITAMTLFEQQRAELLANCRYIAKHLAIRNPRGETTIDEIRSRVTCPEWVNPKFFGSVFSGDKNWEQRGYVKSKREEAHGRPIGVWYYKGSRDGQNSLFNIQGEL